MTKYSLLNGLNQLISELPAAERLAFAKRQEDKSNAEAAKLVATPAYWYIRW